MIKRSQEMLRKALVLVSLVGFGQSYTISTAAGGGLPVGMSGLEADLGTSNGTHQIAIDSGGNLFLALPGYHAVVRIDGATNQISLAAGNGTMGFNGDGGPATSAQLSFPSSVAVDANGNLYIADTRNYRIRRVDPATGVISTVAGRGAPGTAGLALAGPFAIAVNRAGTACFLDGVGTLVYAYRLGSDGGLTRVAGGGPSRDDGVAASQALILPYYSPAAIAVDDTGETVYVADYETHRVRKIENGIVTTVAGTGVGGFAGDGGAATDAQIRYPTGVTAAADGTLLIADWGNSRVRTIGTDGIIRTVAGDGFNLAPYGVVPDGNGNLFIADNSRIRRANGDGIVTVAGRGTNLGDGGPASGAQFDFGGGSPPTIGLAVAPDGGLYLSDWYHGRVRTIQGGLINTVAGGGLSPADDVDATSAGLLPSGVAFDPAGNLLVSDLIRVRKIEDGRIRTIVNGPGAIGFSGDGGPAIDAALRFPRGLAVDPAGQIYVVDSGNGRLRAVATDGTITTVASQITTTAAASDSAGNIYTSDGSRLLRITNGIVTVIAGGPIKYAGDGSPASISGLGGIDAIAIDPDDNIYVDDGRIRRISNGIITTILGGPFNSFGFSGDGGPAAMAAYSYITALAAGPGGVVYFADGMNNRIRALTPNTRPCVAAVSTRSLQVPVSGGQLRLTVQAPDGCPWAVQDLPPWLASMTSVLMRGPATVVLNAAPNTSGTNRAAAVSIAGAAVLVTQ